MTTRLTIRDRERRLASPPAGTRQAWVEWQVLDGRRVVSRHDVRSQAEAWRDQHAPAYPALKGEA